MSIKNTNRRIGTTRNLEQGGTYDLLMISYPDGFPEGQLKFAIDLTPRKVTGVQKVAQTFLKLLMTTKGSNVIYPQQGTRFPLLAINSNITKDDAVLYSELADSVRDAEAQTKTSLNTSETDLASMLDRVEIANLDVAEDSVTMFLVMQTLDGASANLAVPFPELDLA